MMSWKNIFPINKRYFETKNGILYKGDCLEIMSKFSKEIFNAIITDPPYGTTACKWDSVIPFEPMWERLKKIRKDNTPIVLFGNEPFSSYLRMSNIKEYKYDWIWNKKQAGNPFLAKIAPLKIFENIMVFSYKKHNYYPIMRKGLLRKKGGCKVDNRITGTKANGYMQYNDKYYPLAILEFGNTNKKELFHPTQKPIALLEYLIKTYTNEGDLVLDFTCGSGTTLVAAEKLHRCWIGIEINEEYCEIARKRILKEAEQRYLL